MRSLILFTAAIVAVALLADTAAAQGVSVLVRPQQQAQELPAPAPPTNSVEVIATPQPTLPPAPLVLDAQTYAVPVVRWGFFGKRLVPRTVYVRQYFMRPAQVVGPYYYLR